MPPAKNGIDGISGYLTTKTYKRSSFFIESREQKTKSDYLRARLLGESFKVITEDKSNEKYLHELSNIISQIYKIGVLYNEAVKVLNRYHSTATAQRMLRKLEAYS